VDCLSDLYGVPKRGKEFMFVHTSVNAARRSDVAEKVVAYILSEKANAQGAARNDCSERVDGFASPKIGPWLIVKDFFSNVRSACATPAALAVRELFAAPALDP
jgi:hypothetical protein